MLVQAKVVSNSELREVRYRPETLHVKDRKVRRLFVRLAGGHILRLWHQLQVYVTVAKMRLLVTPEQVVYCTDHNMRNTLRVRLPNWWRDHLHIFALRSLQWYSEAVNFSRFLVKRGRLRRVMEIGSRDGGTLALWTRVATDDALIIGVDFDHPTWRIPLYKRMALAEQSIRLIKGNSHDEYTRYLVAKMLEGEQLDMLFIDADHNYDAVKMDWRMYRGFVKAGGLVVFHDIRLDGVPRLWNRIKHDFKYEEIVDETHPIGPVGIGVLYV